MRPLQISADTAVKLAAMLKVPVEHLMHMPQHILLQKMAELAAQMPPAAEAGSKAEPEAANNGNGTGSGTPAAKPEGDAAP